MFSRFFIDRPIFAAVLSIFIVIAGLASIRSLPIAQYPEIAPPVVTVRAVYPGASAETLEQTVAAPLENPINGVEDMLYMSSTSASNGVVRDPGHVRDRRRRGQSGAQREQPREAGRAAAAARGAPAGRHRGERLVGVPAGDRLPVAGRPVRRHLHLELRDAERARRREAHPGHDQRPDLRRQGLRHADLGQARPPVAAQAHHRRRRARDQRAERAVRRRQDRPDADRRAAGARLHHHHEGPARRAGAVREHRRPREPRRLDSAPEGRRARGARLEGLRVHRPRERQAPRPSSGSFCSPARTRWRLATASTHELTRLATRFPDGLSLFGPVRHDALRRGLDPRGADHARRGDGARLPGRVPVPAETGARR